MWCVGHGEFDAIPFICALRVAAWDAVKCSTPPGSGTPWPPWGGTPVKKKLPPRPMVYTVFPTATSIAYTPKKTLWCICQKHTAIHIHHSLEFLFFLTGCPGLSLSPGSAAHTTFRPGSVLHGPGARRQPPEAEIEENRKREKGGGRREEGGGRREDGGGRREEGCQKSF